MQQLMENLGPKFEQATGHKLAVTIATLGPALKRIQDGETYDVVWLPRPGIERLAKEGKAVASTVTVIASTGIGVAVRKGAPKPDISSPEAFKRAMLSAKSVTHGNPKYGGLSGIHDVKVFERLGIAEEMKSKTVLLDKAGLAGVFVANGEAEIVVQPIQELMVVAGIDIVGPLPGDLQDTVAYLAAIMPVQRMPRHQGHWSVSCARRRRRKSSRQWAWSRALRNHDCRSEGPNPLLVRTGHKRCTVFWLDTGPPHNSTLERG